MKKKLILITVVLCLFALSCLAAVVQSGWTSTGNAGNARTALDVFSKGQVTNVVEAYTANMVTNHDTRLLDFPGGIQSDLTSSLAQLNVGSAIYPGLNLNRQNTTTRGIWDGETAIKGSIFYNTDNDRVQVQVIGLNGDGWRSVQWTTDPVEVANTSYGPAQQMAAIITTNNVEDRSRIFVTGNPTDLVNGEYRVRFYDATNFLGVWTNTASTNIIIMNNVSNNVDFTSQPFVIAGKYTGTDQFMYQANQEIIGARGSWINPFASDGMSQFSGGATLKWGTNKTRNFVLVPLNIGIGHPGLVGTNILRVSELGDDETATRLNGYAFKSLFGAFTNSQPGDVIFLEPGYYVTYPFHMNDGNPDPLQALSRRVHIIGSGPQTIIDVIHTDDYAIQHYQSRAIVPWENCTIGNFTLTNGLIALAQYNPIYGGSNVWVHDITIYPPTHMVFTGGTGDAGAADQPAYFNVGMMASRVGPSNVVERVKVFSGQTGFGVQTVYVNQNAELTLIDCEAYCSPLYANGISNIWATVPSIDANVGGMLPIALLAQYQDSQTKYDLNLNIHGGKFVSLNGGTNIGAYVGGEIQSNRNASLWISRAYTNNVRIRFTGVPEFYYGSSNGVAYPILDESTNNKTVFTGYHHEKQIVQFTNSVVTSSGGWTGNPNQFSVANALTNIKSGVLLTNPVVYNGATINGTLNVTSVVNSTTVNASILGVSQSAILQQGSAISYYVDAIPLYELKTSPSGDQWIFNDAANGHTELGYDVNTEEWGFNKLTRFTNGASGPLNAYNATTWNGSQLFATEDAVRDKIESLSGATPPGSDTQVIFNDGGAFGADAGLVYNKSQDTLTLGNAIFNATNSSSGSALAHSLIVTNRALFLNNGVGTIIASNTILTTNITVTGTLDAGTANATTANIVRSSYSTNGFTSTAVDFSKTWESTNIASADIVKTGVVNKDASGTNINHKGFIVLNTDTASHYVAFGPTYRFVGLRTNGWLGTIGVLTNGYLGWCTNYIPRDNRATFLIDHTETQGTNVMGGW